jgi:hypothetical protein
MMELNIENIKLTSNEIGNLWNGYILESMVHHTFTYFLSNVEDKNIKGYLEYITLLSRTHLDKYITIFKKENLAVPRGTTSEDVNLTASRLFSDKFYITYVKSLAKFALTSSLMSLTEATRDDVHALFKDYSNNLIEVDQKGSEIMLSKGIYPVSPEFKATTDVEFVERKDFFTGFLGDKRSLTVMETKQLFQNSHTNALGKALLCGFSKVTKSNELHEYFLKGVTISDRYVTNFSDKLLEEDITPPPLLDNEVADYIDLDAPFSDSLMLNQVVFLNAYGIGNFGLALAQSQRNDLSTMYGLQNHHGAYHCDFPSTLLQL